MSVALDILIFKYFRFPWKVNFWLFEQLNQVKHNLSYSPADESFLGDGTEEENVYEQDVYLGDSEWLIIAIDEVSEKLYHLRLLPEDYRRQQLRFWWSIKIFQHAISVIFSISLVLRVITGNLKANSFEIS